ncbi:hypothetical protein [Nocardia jinanensis]|uniref:Uncharacterized protein n=1 Tax=Nocardia jinanensis TaxID=382504 RepID=A0A917RXI4_9NOCA|nr:hypothetical protein [Nocardia jinanensis]GGL44130.1 hypothetical protein GCM10011588_68540 [Nocardia jinanensis]
MGMHAELAADLAARAGRELQAALDSTTDLPGDGGWLSYSSGREAADRVMWQRVTALQTQAQIHATLALGEVNQEKRAG